MAEQRESFLVYPGIALTFFHLQAENYQVHHAQGADVMHINHCRRGRLVWTMKEGETFFIGPGDLLLHLADCCSQSQIGLPLGSYEGVSISVELNTLTTNPPEILKEAGIDGEKLYKKFFQEGHAAAMPASDQIDHIFSEFYDLPEEVRLPYYKLKVQELLLFLSQMEISEENALDRTLSSQVGVIRNIHDDLVSHPEKRVTIEELAKEYLINTSTLKTVFKAVYGQPLATYMKEYRLQYAAQLLASTDEPISKIARKVGYESPSKFTKAFKEEYRVLPSDYRKQQGKVLRV